MVKNPSLVEIMKYYKHEHWQWESFFIICAKNMYFNNFSLTNCTFCHIVIVPWNYLTTWYEYRQKKYLDMIQFQWIVTLLIQSESLCEPSHEIMALLALHKLILQTRMCNHPVKLDVWFLVGVFVYFHTPCVRTPRALVRLRESAGSPEPSLVTYVISTIVSWAGSNRIQCLCNFIA